MSYQRGNVLWTWVWPMGSTVVRICIVLEVHGWGSDAEDYCTVLLGCDRENVAFRYLHDNPMSAQVQADKWNGS